MPQKSEKKDFHVKKIYIPKNRKSDYKIYMTDQNFLHSLFKVSIYNKCAI